MMMGRQTSAFSDTTPEEHSKQFREFLASELAALQERLVAKFEQREPATTSRVSRPSRRRTETSGSPRRTETSDSLRRTETSGSFKRKSDEEVLQTLPAWDRMVAQLLASTDPTQCGLADMVVHMSNWCPAAPDAGKPSLKAPQQPVQESLITPHTVWISQDVQRQRPPKAKNDKSKFAASRIRDPGAPALSMGSDSMDTMDTEIFQRKAGGLSRWFVIHPDSVFRYLWCLIGAVFLMHDLFAIPMEAVGLWPSGSSGDFIVVAIAYWCTDLFIQSVTGYHTQSYVEMRPFKVFIAYASTWMPLDLVVVLIDVAWLVFRFNSTARSFRILKLLRLVRFTRLHKWVLALKSFMRHNTSELLDLSVKIGRLMFFLVCHCHFTACAWYGIAETFEDVERRPGERNWVEASGVAGESQAMRYAVALHWSITQFTPATNNVNPVTGAERVFAIVMVLFGLVTFSGFFSTMMGTLSQLESIKQSHGRERRLLLQFFRAKRIQAALANKVLRLFNAECKLKRDHIVEDDLTMLSSLPLSLRLRIRAEYCLPVLQRNDILGGVYLLDRRCFLQVIHEAMKDQRCYAQQEVFVDGIEANHMYAVTSGRFKYCQSGESPFIFSRGWVSEASLYVQWVHQGSLVAKSCSEMMKLDCQVLRQIVLQTGGDLFRVLCCCAVLFAHKLEVSVEDHETLSDLGLSHDEQNEILGRALKSCKVHRRVTSWAVSVDDRAGTPSVLWNSFRKRLGPPDLDSDDEDEAY